MIGQPQVYEVLERMGIAFDYYEHPEAPTIEIAVQFYRGEGCPSCFDTGYRGRIAVFEMLNINARVRRLIADGASRPEIEDELKRPENGFVSLRDNAMRLVREGITTTSELLRVVSEED